MKSKTVHKQVTVLLMTYGSPATLDDVPGYLKNIYSGRDPNPEAINKLRRRYELIGGSPLLEITQAQAKALEKELNRHYTNGLKFKVVAGMRFAPPFIADVIADAGENINRIIGIIMSPQYSPIIMQGYVKALENAVQQLDRTGIPVTVANDWHDNQLFIEALSERVNAGLAQFPIDVRGHIPVLFTAHSMLKHVVDKEPGYISKLQGTARLVAKQVKLPKNRWLFCYQSAGHSPQEWLKPDFADIMPQLAAKGHTHVLVAPVQFLADHLEILYDIDIAARQQAEEQGLQFNRIESLNTSPLFIKALADITKKEITKITS